MARGVTSPPLVFEAIGLPAIVTYWAQGWFPVPTYEPGVPPDTPFVAPDAPPSAREALSANAVTGKTVGIEPLPIGATPVSLTVRLLGLANEACALGWIRVEAICTNLRAMCDRARRALEARQWQVAAGHLRAALRELEAQHGDEPGKHVSDSAYWLLRINAEYILKQL